MWYRYGTKPYCESFLWRVGPMLMTPARRTSGKGQAGRNRYVQPAQWHSVWLRDLLNSVNRGSLKARQLDIFRSADDGQAEDAKLFWAGDLKLLSRPCVSIVGTREATHEGQTLA